MYYEVCTWQREPTLQYLMEECNLLDCATEEEIERVGKYITSHICNKINMILLAEMVASYSKPVCNMKDFVTWVLIEISNHCVNRCYFRREEQEE